MGVNGTLTVIHVPFCSDVLRSRELRDLCISQK